MLKLRQEWTSEECECPDFPVTSDTGGVFGLELTDAYRPAAGTPTVRFRQDKMSQRISPAQACRIALAAQGFGRRRPDTVEPAHLRKTVARLALHQIDSVNVLTRAHYFSAFSVSAPTTGACSNATPGAPREPAACSSTGRTRLLCSRSNSTRTCAGAWRERSAARPATARCGSLPQSDVARRPDPARTYIDKVWCSFRPALLRSCRLRDGLRFTRLPVPGKEFV